jgi:DNA repair ATPase RecN
MRAAWRELAAARRRHDEIARDAASAQARLTELEALVEDAAGFEPDTEASLLTERERLRHVTELAEGAASAAEALSPDDGDGAAVLAAREHGAARLVDPRPFAVGSIAETLRAHPHLREVLPAMGYGRRQMDELCETIARSDAELVLVGTPIDLRRVIELDKPALRVSYRLEEVGEPTLADALAARGLIESPALV